MADKHVELQGKGIQPYWCIHHGITVSPYYADLDGNQMEFQTDCFTSNDDANGFMFGPSFELNSIGVEFDPEVMPGHLRAGTPESQLLPRRDQRPVSEIRGSLMA